MHAVADLQDVLRQEHGGSEAYILTGYLNIPKVFQLTLYNGFDKESGNSSALRPVKQKISSLMMNYGMHSRNS